MPNLCVFCGSGLGRLAEYRDAAAMVGKLLVERGWGLVYGGSQLGLMGVVADTVTAGGGSVVGVVPKLLVEKEAAHTGLADLRVVATMHERKALMADLSDAFLALPGGIGTLDELCEIVTWAQLGLHCKPIGLLNTGGYWDGLLGMLDHAVAEGFIKTKYRSLVRAGSDPVALLEELGVHARGSL